MRSLKDFDFKNKRALVRCDFNVPLDKNGNILDDFRIKKTLPTIEYLIKQNAKAVLMSHLGDPEGKVVEALSLKPVQKKLQELLKVMVYKSSDCVGNNPEAQERVMQWGEVLLLENLRFHAEEEANDDVFSKKLASLGDIYVNDAFGTCHRKHASMVGVPKYLPSCHGLLLEKEIYVLDNFINNAVKPVVAMIGGKKVETKAALIDKISEFADFVLVGGLIQKELAAKNIQLKHPEKILGPVDETGGGKDIGPETVKLFGEKIKTAKTVFWNGPLGLTEDEQFKKGTAELAKIISQSSAFSIVGGGETADFLKELGLLDKFSHVSTGGGAMLSYLSGEKLPALELLK